MTPTTSDLRIGTSGWSYPSGKGTWNGVFYPPARKRPKGFDELAFYAEHFNTVELNSTFYGQAPGGPPGRGGADAAGLRVLGEAVPEVHAPPHVPRARRARAAGRRARRRRD